MENNPTAMADRQPKCDSGPCFVCGRIFSFAEEGAVMSDNPELRLPFCRACRGNGEAALFIMEANIEERREQLTKTCRQVRRLRGQLKALQAQILAMERHPMEAAA